MFIIEARKIYFCRFIGGHICDSELSAVSCRPLNSPVMILLIGSLANHGDIDDVLADWLASVLAEEDVLKLVTCKGNNTLLVRVENISSVAVRVEVWNEGSRIVTGGERLVSNDRFSKA